MEPLVDEPEDRTVIPLNKKKILLLFLGCLVAVAGAIWMITKGDIIIGWVVLILPGLAVVFLLFKLSDMKPGLIVNKAGLINNSSGIAAREVLWSDVCDMAVFESKSTKMVFLNVHNPEQYIDREKNVLVRFILRQNFNMYGSPIGISTVGLKISFDELLDILNRYYTMSRN